MKKVAVITRTLNRPRLLSRAIESVHGQTLKDFVHVIINDGGDAAVVDEVLKQYKTLTGDRVKVIHNIESSGMEAASNTAIKSVDSVFVAIHDDDDTWHPEFLARTVEHLEESDAMGVVVRSNKVVEELRQDGTVKHIKTSQWLPDLKAINLYRQCSTTNQMTPITFIYRRAIFAEIGYYDEALPVCGDWDFGIRFLQKHDVDFLDPGFALANYHHRKFKANTEGNTSYAGNNKAAYWTNYVMNKYLRQELADGRLGVGYIMSKIRYDESRLAQFMKRLVPIKGVAKMIKRRAQD